MTQIKSSEISRTIAELLEPLGSFAPDWKETPMTCGGYNQYGNVIWVSPKKIWSFEEKNHLEWQPLDFEHDPRGTVMLLKTKTHYGYIDILDDCDAVGIFDYSGEMDWLVEIDIEEDRSNLQQAVARAFLRANGIEVVE